MADSTVAISSAVSPDKNLDAATYVNDDGTTVYRERVEDPELIAVLRSVRGLLVALASTVRNSQHDPLTANVGPADAPAAAVGVDIGHNSTGGGADTITILSTIKTLGAYPESLALRIFGSGITIGPTMPAWPINMGQSAAASLPSYHVLNLRALQLRRKITVS